MALRATCPHPHCGADFSHPDDLRPRRCPHCDAGLKWKSVEPLLGGFVGLYAFLIIGTGVVMASFLVTISHSALFAMMCAGGVFATLLSLQPSSPMRPYPADDP